MRSARQSITSTPRRSRRHLVQPIVQAGALGALTQGSSDFRWTSQSIKSRPAVCEDLDDDEGWDENDPGTTIFYTSYIHDVTSQLQKMKRAKKAKVALPENEEFKLGDTVLVKTFAKEPSVAVITAMWTIAMPVEVSSDEEGGSDGESGHLPRTKTCERMIVRLHWFTRPQELASVRSKRNAADVSSNSLSPSQ
jgi:origin recognition complex subunit 1